MIVVVALVGAGGYFAFNTIKPTNGTTTTCAPPTSFVCVKLLAAHDMNLLVPFKVAQAGTAIPFTATFTRGESSASYGFNFGDGSNATSKTSSISHTFQNPGTYLVSVTSSVAGLTHDNYQSLVQIIVTPSYESSHSGSAPAVSGSLLKNTSSSSAPTGVIAGSGTVTLAGSYASAPTNPAFVPSAPSFQAKGASSFSGNATTATSYQTTITYASAGIYQATFVGVAMSGGTTAYQNYTWTVFVAPSGVNAGVAGSTAVPKSPHKGTLTVFEDIPGGSSSEDPALDYESAGYEPIINVYQTLITYNASDSGSSYADFVPELASCVPGSPQCSALFGNNLSSGSDLTFVISASSQFYDPTGHKSWGVYPSDVLFSLARTMGFAAEPSFGANNGWIVSQALLSTGSRSWDGGIHDTLNNTPSNVFAAITVNDSSCPSAALTDTQLYHGCVTLHADANGVAWPYFLELIADPLGSAIVPCGFFSAAPQDAGIPGWTYNGTAADPNGYKNDQGDHPCLLPGGAKSSSDAAFTTAVNGIPANLWDSWQLIGSGTQPVGGTWGNTRWTMAGSGPYYMASLSVAASYFLKANPAYAQNPDCTWAQCEPAPGHYVGNVSVVWEASQLPGEEAYQAGAADLASIPPTDAALLLQLIQEGKVGATSFPSISIDFFVFSLAFSRAAASHYSSAPITVPQDFFANVGLRNFMVNTYPYATIGNTISTKDGIQYFFQYGGAIPQFMQNYYPTNVSWPGGDPSTSSSTPGTAAWWWSQVTNPSSGFYDSELSGCSASNPCQFTFFGESGVPDVDQRLALWASEVHALSGGALVMNIIDINFVDLVLNSLYSAPYTIPMPAYNLAWAPDYPDPTDYMVPLYQPDGSYTHADAISEVLEGFPTPGTTPYNQTSCTASHPYNDYGYWAQQASTPGGITNACQGTAYAAMSAAIAAAAHMPAGPARVLTYNEIEHIGNALALYVYWGQQNIVVTAAPWIDPGSYNENVAIGGGTDSTWYTITGNGLF